MTGLLNDRRRYTENVSKNGTAGKGAALLNVAKNPVKHFRLGGPVHGRLPFHDKERNAVNIQLVQGSNGSFNLVAARVTV